MRDKKIKKSTIYFFVGSLIYKILLDFSYAKLISPYFSYMGMELNINFMKYLESFFITIIVLLALCLMQKTFSSLFIKVYVLTGYLPVGTFYSLNDNNRHWFYLWTFFVIILIVFSQIRFFNLKLKIKYLKEGNLLNMIFLSIFSILSLLLLIRHFGFAFNFNILDVYDIRAEHHLSLIPFGGYIINWTAKVFIPFLVLFFLFEKRNYFIFCFLIVIQLLIFSLTGHKTYLFLIIAVIFLAIILDKFEKFLPFMLSSLIILGFALNYLLGDIIFNSLLLRRVFFVPAQLSFYYYDFFKDNPIFLSHSVFKYFLNYQYDLPPAKMIALVYLGNPDTNANNGVVADGFMNFGSFGVLLWAIFFILFLKLADFLTAFKNKRVLYPLFMILFYNVINSALLTTISTHGLILTFLIAYLLKKEKFSFRDLTDANC